MKGAEVVDNKAEAAFQPSLSWRACVALIAAVTTLALDYVTKVFVKNTLMVTGESFSAIPGILSFRFVANEGAAFSLGEGMGLLFAAFAVLVVIAILQYLSRARQVSKLETLGLGLVAGGALGNAIDRLALGYVVDFIATDFIDFPVFNVADIGICVGVFLAFAGFMFLSPAAKVDATAELNARDEAAAARRARRRAARGSRARGGSGGHVDSGGSGGAPAGPEDEHGPAAGGDA